MNGRLPASLVIPTYNRVHSLARTLRAVGRQEAVPDEVIVVDDASPDHTPSWCASFELQETPFRFRLVRQRRNLGPAAARNLGIAHARHEIVLFTDDDCEPEPPWAGELLRVLAQDSGLAGVGGPVRAAPGCRFGLFFDHHRLLDPKFVGREAHPAYLVTANAAYRRDWLLRIGGFDEDLRRPGGEDPGLSFKIAAAGGRLGYAPNAIVRHHYPRRVRSVVRMFWNYGYGGAHVARAYPGPE